MKVDDTYKQNKMYCQCAIDCFQNILGKYRLAKTQLVLTVKCPFGIVASVHRHHDNLCSQLDIIGNRFGHL